MVPVVLTDIDRVGWDNTEDAPYSSVGYFRGDALYGLTVADVEFLASRRLHQLEVPYSCR